MYLHSLSTAVPEQAYTQRDCWDIIERSEAKSRLSKRTRLILHSILKGDHGVQKRHFALDQIERIFDRTSDELNAAFRREAPALAEKALVKALASAGLKASELDALFVCTCTGYLCPGVSSYVAESLGMSPRALLHDVVGLGCGAAIPTLRAASHFLAANPKANAACVAVEVCSAAFFLDDDPGVLISACLFSDGAAASIWKGSAGATGLRAYDFRSLHLPGQRDQLRFEHKDGKLRNLLDRSVPQLAAGAVESLWSERGAHPIARVVAHTGGRDVLDALEPVVAPHSLDASRRTLAQYGNMSSPSVLFALESTVLESGAPQEGDFWLVSFGAGFSAHSCRIGKAP